MTRPLTEYLLRVLWMTMDYLLPYIAPTYLERWTEARGFLETVQFQSLSGDEQFG